MIKPIFAMTLCLSFVNAASDQKNTDSEPTVKLQADKDQGGKNIKNPSTSISKPEFQSWMPYEYPGMSYEEGQ